MTEAEKAFNKWLREKKNIDMKKRGCKTSRDVAMTVFCDGYEIGRKEEFKSWLETAHWCDDKFRELEAKNLDLLAQIALKD